MAARRPRNLVVHPARVERFPLRLPIWYRPVGAVQWAEGITENISARGVFVRGTVLPELNEPLDFRFKVEVGSHQSEVACRGAVVRTDRRGTGGPSFAATIDVFTFVPRDK
jgi:hypothetical protein